MFNRSGQVQTCIVNKDKRHAFVKMITRKDAVAAKEAMENSQYRVSRDVNAKHMTPQLTMATAVDQMGCWFWSSRL